MRLDRKVASQSDLERVSINLYKKEMPRLAAYLNNRMHVIAA